MDTPKPDRNFHLERDAFDQLVLIQSDGRRHVGVAPVRAFPISDGSHWIAICDAQGHEILAIEDLEELDAEIQRLLREELSRREFTPVIRRIISATKEEPSRWCVETDRGRATFEVGSEEDVRRIEPHQASIVDSHQVRYWIPDIRQLDTASRRILDHYL